MSDEKLFPAPKPTYRLELQELDASRVGLVIDGMELRIGLSSTRILVDLDGTIHAWIWRTQLGTEHWLFTELGFDWSADRYLLLQAPISRWQGVAGAPTPMLPELDEPRYTTLLFHQAAPALSRLRRVVELPSLETFRPSRSWTTWRPPTLNLGVASFDVHTLGGPETKSQPVALLSVRPTSSTLQQTRTWEREAHDPFAQGSDLMLVRRSAKQGLEEGAFREPHRVQAAGAMRIPADSGAPAWSVGILFQLDEGSANIFDEGRHLGRIHTRRIAQSAGEWEELWRVHDERRLLDSPSGLLVLAGNQEELHFGREARLVFRYEAPPAAAQFTDPDTDSVLSHHSYEVWVNEQNQGARLAGHLYRQRLSLNGAEHWRDRWILQADYSPPSLRAAVSLRPLQGGFVSAAAFIQDQEQRRQSAPGWRFVAVTYRWIDRQQP